MQECTVQKIITALSKTGIRRPVPLLAIAMEGRLRRHDADRGEEAWVNDDVNDLLRYLGSEFGELCDATNSVAMLREAADVANLAMMVSDAFAGRLSCAEVTIVVNQPWEAGDPEFSEDE